MLEFGNRRKSDVRAIATGRVGRELLGEALALLGEATDVPPHLREVVASLARALEAMFAGDSASAGSPEAARALDEAVSLVGQALVQIETVRALSRARAVSPPLGRVAEPIAAAQAAAFSPPVAYSPPKAEGVIPLDPRRRVERVPIEVRVGFESESNFYTGFTQDVGSGGIFVATYVHLPIGSLVSLRVVLPAGHVVAARGRVRWRRDLGASADATHPGLGIAFEDLTPADAAAVADFLASRAPIFFEE